MSQYRIFQSTASWISRILIFLLGFMLLVITAESIRIFLLLKRIHPITGYGFVVFMAITGMLLVAAIAAGRRRSNRILQARGFVCDEKSSHKRLSRALAHYIGICSRLGSHRLLSADRKKAIFQGAHDLQQALDHHPLKDDLRRGIDVARERIIQPALGELNTINNKITASKARAVVEDYYLPYFPALAPWMVVYHQFTLVSEIADIYLPRPTLREYFTVVRDTWRIMREGNLLHHGQRYFASIEAANAPLGPAADELIQAMSIIWLTHCVSRTATVRCTTYHDWNARDSIEEIKNQLGNLMQSTHESIVQDALPFLKRRLHRYADKDRSGRDISIYVNETIQSFIKSLENVGVIALSRPRVESGEPIKDGYEASPGEKAEATASSDEQDGQYHDHHHQHRHRRRRSRGAFRRFIDKLAGREAYY